MIHHPRHGRRALSLRLRLEIFASRATLRLEIRLLPAKLRHLVFQTVELLLPLLRLGAKPRARHAVLYPALVLGIVGVEVGADVVLVARAVARGEPRAGPVVRVAAAAAVADPAAVGRDPSRGGRGGGGEGGVRDFEIEDAVEVHEVVLLQEAAVGGNARHATAQARGGVRGGDIGVAGGREAGEGAEVVELGLAGAGRVLGHRGYLRGGERHGEGQGRGGGAGGRGGKPAGKERRGRGCPTQMLRTGGAGPGARVRAPSTRVRGFAGNEDVARTCFASSETSMVGEQPGTWTVSRSGSRSSGAAMLRRSSTLRMQDEAETGGDSDATARNDADASAETRRRRVRRGGRPRRTRRSCSRRSRAVGRARRCARPFGGLSDAL